MPDFTTEFATLRSRVDTALAMYLPPACGNSLGEAMGYALAGGGKRIRPILVFAGYSAIDAEANHPALDCIAAAVEAIHAYSLVHDDLPAMDDDDLRRGKPTCHIAFDEATAILAGDGLQTLAFELLAEAPGLTDAQKLEQVRILAKASGSQGMVLGQAIDLAAVNQALSLVQLEQMHRLKTGALISASVDMGAAAADASTEQRARLKRYSDALGLAFQVQDDILDVTASTAVLGKQQGADQARNKPTYVSLLGLEAARDKARALYQSALAELAGLPGDTSSLQKIAQYVVEREH